MKELKPAVIGIGATGTVLAAALLRSTPGAALVVPDAEKFKRIKNEGLTVTGALDFKVPVENVISDLSELSGSDTNLIFICTKAFGLRELVEKLGAVLPRDETLVVSCHNGLGTEETVAEVFGKENAFRMSLNYGAASRGPGNSEVAFINPPNPVGGLTQTSKKRAEDIAALLSSGDLATEAVEDIKLSVWKKMVMKCTMASICAIADMTIREALDYPPTREIADACFQEVMAVAKAQGYDLGNDYLTQGIAYLSKVGIHKDSMCHDIEAGRPTEIDVLGAKVVEYAKEKGIPVPYYISMSNMVRAVEKRAIEKSSS
ncbi:MAG: hypothetical protein C0608_07700 [Deltaproteobacteria bacterium]|nr:MAG: hypothetical protein C0608_07700 [Deltaproteobacteria bacterium]